VKRSTRAWAPTVAWALLLFVMSSIPGQALPPLGGSFFGIDTDKLVHGSVYAVLGALIWRSLRLTRPLLSPPRAVLIAAAAAALYGVTDELHQLFTLQRSADWRDAVADGAGGLAGAALGSAIGMCVSFATHRQER
jgi:VanZ family protein